MAIYPCRLGGHRYPQPQQMAYCSVVAGTTARTYRARLCPKHFRDVVTFCEESMVLVDEDTSSNPVCESCGDTRVGAVFLRAFPSRETERTFAADTCGPCTDTILARLQIDLWEPLTDR